MKVLREIRAGIQFSETFMKSFSGLIRAYSKHYHHFLICTVWFYRKNWLPQKCFRKESKAIWKRKCLQMWRFFFEMYRKLLFCRRWKKWPSLCFRNNNSQPLKSRLIRKWSVKFTKMKFFGIFQCNALKSALRKFAMAMHFLWLSL